MPFVVELVISLLIVIGGAFLLIGSFGMIKLRELLPRLHAPTKGQHRRAGWGSDRIHAVLLG